MSGRATDSSPTEALAGLVERVTFHNAENGFCVLRVKARGQRDLVTVVGHAAMISAGEFVQMSGRWFNDHTHGLQFKGEFLKASPPTTVEGIERYLGSGMIRDIGPVYAKKLVKAFGEAMDEGHCGLPVGELLTSTAELLEVVAALIETALTLELEAGDVVADSVGETGCIFLTGLYRAEQSIAERLRACAVGRPPWPEIDAEKAMTWVDRKTGLALAPSQQEAVRLALRSKLLVITGGPGVGKTTLVNAILKIVTGKGTDVQLCAPTGRAAKRLSESTGLEGKTIHRLLETDPAAGSFKRDDTNPLTCDLLVLDEASMVDVLLMRSLLRALPDNAALLIVGDVDQLPSVGPGQVLADTISSNAVPVVRLTEVFRQAAQSRIITNAHRINEGRMPELSAEEGSDFYFVEAAEPEIGLRKLLAVVKDRIPSRFGLDPVRDVQVLCPMNRGGPGARSLNIELQQALNPPAEVKVERFGWTYGPGDKVMQIANDYDRDVFNGDLGVIGRIDVEEGELTVLFDGREVVYGFGELDELVLAYATTIHKSQGSEYPVVVIPLVTQHYAMLARNLLYTGVTRGRKLVVLVGQKKALAIAVRNQGGRHRWSKLREWLAGSFA